MNKIDVLDNKSYSIKKNSISLIKPHSICFDMNKCVRILKKSSDSKLVTERMKEIGSSK